MKSTNKLFASLLFFLLLTGMVLAPSPLRAEFGYPVPHIFPPLVPYLGNYTVEELYDPDFEPTAPPKKDMPPDEMAKIDPKSTPYPILMEEVWRQDTYTHHEKNNANAELLILAKKGNPQALAEVHILGRGDKPLMKGLLHRLADSLTVPGWSFGIRMMYKRGIHLGDGYSIYRLDGSPFRSRARLAAVAGYPEAMGEAGFRLQNEGFCAASLAWTTEAAMRGYDKAWNYVAQVATQGCLVEGIPPDLLTGYAAYDFLRRKTARPELVALASLNVRELKKTFNEQQRAQAEARSEALIAQWEKNYAERLRAQREHIRKQLPAVVEAINAEMDKIIQGSNDFPFELSIEDAKWVRSQ